MIDKHQQLFRHDPENGVYGDCVRTVIACLLKLAPEDVPHFCDGPDDPSDPDAHNRALKGWLASRGYALLTAAFNGSTPLVDVMEMARSYSCGMHWMLSGVSRNGCNHVVICLEDTIVHDTSIDQSGIVGPMDNGIWTIEWLVRPAPCDMRLVAA